MSGRRAPDVVQFGPSRVSGRRRAVLAATAVAVLVIGVAQVARWTAGLHVKPSPIPSGGPGAVTHVGAIPSSGPGTFNAPLGSAWLSLCVGSSAHHTVGSKAHLAVLAVGEAYQPVIVASLTVGSTSTFTVPAGWFDAFVDRSVFGWGFATPGESTSVSVGSGCPSPGSQTWPMVTLGGSGLPATAYPLPVPALGQRVGLTCPSPQSLQVVDPAADRMSLLGVAEYQPEGLWAEARRLDPVLWAELADSAGAARRSNAGSWVVEAASASPYHSSLAASCGPEIVKRSLAVVTCDQACTASRSQALAETSFWLRRAGTWLLWHVQ